MWHVWAEKRNTYRVLEGIHGRKRIFGRPRRIWENSVTLDLIQWDGRACIGIIWVKKGQTAGCRGHGNELFGSIK